MLDVLHVLEVFVGACPPSYVIGAADRFPAGIAPEPLLPPHQPLAGFCPAIQPGVILTR